MSNAIKQHEERVKHILGRRGNPNYKEPEFINNGITPAKQAESMAVKVLAKQGKTIPEPKKDTVEATYSQDEEILEKLTKRELKAKLDDKGITYPAKATNDALITLLKGSSNV